MRHHAEILCAAEKLGTAIADSNLPDWTVTDPVEINGHDFRIYRQGSKMFAEEHRWIRTGRDKREKRKYVGYLRVFRKE